MTSERELQLTTAYWNDRSKGRLPGLLGVTLLEIEVGRALGEIALRPELWAPNGFLHAATVIGLADTLCGYGCVASLPEGATGFTTVETKSNHLGTATEGTISCSASLVHGGRTTQVWDATVNHNETGKTKALFRCTQMVLWPR
ncbi:MAG: PaaI family thioesterase [Anaerolineaceae bacterium]